MKIITETKLPKFLVSRLPLGEEEEEMSSMVVPMLLFPAIAIGILWYNFHNPSWIILEIVATIAIMAFIFITAWWISVQVEILITLRKRYKSLYNIVQTPEEKLEIKNKLAELYVSV